ncbi:tetratricopeptide repeat protein [Pseudooceanicola sp. MF1-13]|uniref:tetratricopeptide repeat protein n=1 Tax=Pseudooceanicola sp. MF1-13 TaxID=3379095 RepID=UPI00389125C1
MVSKQILKPIVTAFAIAVPGALFAQAQGGATDDLLQRLQDADPVDAKKIERELDLAWRRSGSASMDLLMTRGSDALEAGDVDKAIGHFSALIDHAPGFAEAWHRRAQAFYRQEEFGLAVADLGQTLTLNPNHFNAIYGLGVIFESLDKPDEAFELYSRVLEMYPTHERAIEAQERLQGKITGQTL